MTGARGTRRLGQTMTLAAVTMLTLAATAAAAGEAGGKAGARTAKAAERTAGLTVLDLAGLRAEMRKARGHDLFIHLWASWCGPCLEELPDIDRLARAVRARGATFLSVSLDEPGRRAKVLESLRQAPDLTRFVGHFEAPEQLAGLFSGEWDGALPALFVYDGAGRLRASFVGALENADIRRMMGDLDTAPANSPQH